jgi:hypothetical protein
MPRVSVSLRLLLKKGKHRYLITIEILYPMADLVFHKNVNPYLFHASFRILATPCRLSLGPPLLPHLSFKVSVCIKGEKGTIIS